jgi:hypothetical protein
VACFIGDAVPPTPGSWVYLTESCVASQSNSAPQLTNQKNGESTLRSRALHARGYVVVRVPWYDWQQLGGSSAVEQQQQQQQKGCKVDTSATCTVGVPIAQPAATCQKVVLS